MKWLASLTLLCSTVFSSAYAGDTARVCYFYFEQSRSGHFSTKTVMITNCGDGKVSYEKGKPGHPHYFKREFLDETDFWQKAKTITLDHAAKNIVIQEKLSEEAQKMSPWGRIQAMWRENNGHPPRPVEKVSVFSVNGKYAFDLERLSGTKYSENLFVSDRAGREISALIQQFSLFCFSGKADEEEKDCRFLRKDDLSEKLRFRE